jgi:S1-C subfamily serine protease
MRLLRGFGVVLVAAVVAGTVSAVAYVLRPPTTPVTGRGLAPEIGAAPGNTGAAARASQSLVRVVTGTLATPAPGAVTRGGTGVVVDQRGFIVTAEAVVSGASRLAVEQGGGAPIPARLVGSDPTLGLSLLRVDGGASLRPIDVDTSTTLRPGSGVVLVAAPPAFEVALGGIASVGVSTGIDDPSHPGQKRILNHLVAIDITPRDGQLGGAVVEANGRLLGLVVASGQGALAAPSADVQSSVRQLIDTGHVSYPALGFEYAQLSAPEASDRGVPAGVLVLSVTDGSAAAREGILPGTVVVSVNGTMLDPGHPLRRLLGEVPVHQAVSAVTRTAGTERSLSLPVELVTY